MGVLRDALQALKKESLPPGLAEVEKADRKVQLNPNKTCPKVGGWFRPLHRVTWRCVGLKDIGHGAPLTFLQQQSTGLGRAVPLTDKVLVELLETNGLEDAVLVVLPGEQDKRQGSKQLPSEQWETQISASHPAGTSVGDTSPWPQGTSQARHQQQRRQVPSVPPRVSCTV